MSKLYKATAGTKPDGIETDGVVLEIPKPFRKIQIWSNRKFKILNCLGHRLV